MLNVFMLAGSSSVALVGSVFVVLVDGFVVILSGDDFMSSAFDNEVDLNVLQSLIISRLILRIIDITLLAASMVLSRDLF